MATLNGTDTQQNLFSADPGGCGIGIGGPHPISLPPNSFPTDGVYDPANSASQLGAQLGANSTSPAAYDAILKLADGLSGVMSLMAVKVAQGFQDSLNANNAVSNIAVNGDFGISGPPGLRVITIKGGCSKVTVMGTIHQHGTEADVEIDEWSDQNLRSSTGVDLSGLAMADGTLIKVVARYGCSVNLGSHGKRDVLGSLGLTAYWWFKRVVRVVLRIKIGASGPSWLA